MRKYFAAAAIVLILLSISFIYKSWQASNIFKNFPFALEDKNRGQEKKLLLFLFFNKNTCKSCLEVIDVLDGLPDFFKLYGVVPDAELKNEMDIRGQTGVTFDLLSIKKFKKYKPFYIPTLLGVFGRKIYFVIPAVPGAKDNIYELVMSFYYTATSL